MNVEDMIIGHRNIIESLEIDDSKKKNMLKVFDKTVSLYKGTTAEQVAEAITEIATYTESEEATMKVAKILRLDEIINTINLYQDKKETEGMTEAIIDTALWTRSEEAIIEIAKTLALYHNKKELEKVAEAIKKTAYNTRSEKATIEVAKTLKSYQNKEGVAEVVETITEIATHTQSGKSVIETAKTLKNIKDIDNLDRNLFNQYIKNVLDKIYEPIKYSLSFKDINKITDTYILIMGFCKKEGEDFKQEVKEGFFYHLNEAIDTGKKRNDKLIILNKWSDNVYYTFKDHPEDFMEFIR